MTVEIFISHSHADHRLASRLERLLREVSMDRFRVRISSKNGDVPYGANWVDWINTRVDECDVALVTITPSSLRGNWVSWEAGAVMGAQRAKLASEGGDPKALMEARVRPVLFGVTTTDYLGPFEQQQFADGLDPAQLTAFLKQLLGDYRGRGVDARVIDDPVEPLESRVARFVADARDALRYTPIVKTEGLVQEWIQRLDAALARGEVEWVRGARRWINIAFLGAGNAEARQPVDFRLHMRIARALGDLEDWDGQLEQLELASRQAPNDLAILRELGKAALDRGGETGQAKAGEILEQMEQLDAQIFQLDREAVALKLRHGTEAGAWSDVEATHASLRGPLARDQYLANLVAIGALNRLGWPGAKPAFERLGEVLAATRERSRWVTATRVNHALALGAFDRAAEELARLDLPDASARDVASMTKHFDQILAARREAGEDGSAFDWRAAAGLSTRR